MNGFLRAALAAVAAVGALACTSTVRAQARGVLIESQLARGQDRSLLEQAGQLREAGKLVSKEVIARQLRTPVPGPIRLPKARSRRLRGREVAERARQGYVRLGWYFLCQRCEHWHFRAAAGYAIASDAVVTCHHCVEPDSSMREAYLVAVDAEGTVVPVTGVLAKSKTMDAAIVRVDGGRFTPLPLNDNVAPGDVAYCFSEPLGQSGYLSVGIVNRFYWRPSRSGKPGSLDEVKSLRVNASTDWAPGSSGAAVLDECGNVIGHVSTIAPLSEQQSVPGPKSPRGTPKSSEGTPEKEDETPKKPGDKSDEHADSPPQAPAPKPDQDKESPAPHSPQPRDRFNGAVLITLHEAVPARGVLALAKTLPEGKPRRTTNSSGYGRR